MTTDILLPLLAEKLPSAAWQSLPKSVRLNLADPERLMYSALKPTISKKEKVAAASQQAVRTAIEEGIPVSEAGFEKLSGELQKMNLKREEIIGGAPKPEMVLEPKAPQRAIAQGGAPDFQLGPTVPPPGTRQTVLSHARGQMTPPEGAANLGEYMEGITHSYTGEPVSPRRVRVRLEQAGNQQLIEEINRRARESGLLDSLQAAARKAGQPVPYDISEAFNISFKNVIDPKKVAARVEQLKRRYRTVAPDADFATIDATLEEFLRNYPAPMSYKQAQTVRAATSRKLGEKAYLAQTSPARAATEMALERTIMNDLKNALPELKALNAREHKMLGLETELRRALGRTKNWEVWSGIVGGSAAVVGGAIGTALGGGAVGAEAASASALLALALRDPMVKSKLAIALNRAQKLFPEKFGTPNLKSNTVRIDAYLADLEKSLPRAVGGGVAASEISGANAPAEEEDQP